MRASCLRYDTRDWWASNFYPTFRLLLRLSHMHPQQLRGRAPARQWQAQSQDVAVVLDAWL